MNAPVRDLMDALMQCSIGLQTAHTKARALGREDLCQDLRRAGWKVAKAISELVPDQDHPTAEVVS